MIKLTERDKKYLLYLGHFEGDLKLIENAEYKFFSNYGREVTEDFAIKKLGRKLFVAGLAKAFFRGTSVKECTKGNGVVNIKRV